MTHKKIQTYSYSKLKENCWSFTKNRKICSSKGVRGKKLNC